MVIIMASTVSSELENYMLDLFKGIAYTRLSTMEMLHNYVIQHPEKSMQQCVFVADLDIFGLDLTFLALVQRLMVEYPSLLNHSSGLLIVKSDNQWHTKTFSSWLMFNLNSLGCRFIGHPVIEMTKHLDNLNQWEKTTGLDRQSLLHQLSHKTLDRFLKPNMISDHLLKPKITALHASSRSTSNTLSLWNMVKHHLDGCDVQECHVANGTIMDCIGCTYQTCLYFGRQQSCFYGGDIVKELFPAIEQSDALVWICPNYNDSLSANLMAVINRLTALYRTRSFYDKKIYAVIVSGNSGSDAVARQLIDALCMNKGFHLPPHFFLTATAYDPGSIYQVPEIEKRAAEFAALMELELHSPIP